MKTLNTNEISTLSINVTEEITKRNIYSFIKTAILNNNVSVSKNTYYYFYFHSNILTYEIIFYEKTSDKITVMPFLITQKLNENDDIIKIFLVTDYFVVSKNNKVLIFKKVNSINLEEISLYVKQIYKIEEFKMIEVRQDYVKTITQGKDFVAKYDFYPLYPKKSFYIFSVFVILTLIGLILMIYTEYYKVKHVKTTKPVNNLVVKVSSNSSIDKTLELFKYIKLNGIMIEKVSSSNKKIKTILYHHQKSQLLLFANTYKNKFNIKLLKYDDIKGMYSMEIVIEY